MTYLLIGNTFQAIRLSLSGVIVRCTLVFRKCMRELELVGVEACLHIAAWFVILVLEKA